MHTEAFDAIVQMQIEKITDNYAAINSDLLNGLIELRRNQSSKQVESITVIDEFKGSKQSIMSVSETQSQMTSLYLKDISLVLTLVSSARESNLEMYLAA